MPPRGGESVSRFLGDFNLQHSVQHLMTQRENWKQVFKPNSSLNVQSSTAHNSREVETTQPLNN